MSENSGPLKRCCQLTPLTATDCNTGARGNLYSGHSHVQLKYFKCLTRSSPLFFSLLRNLDKLN